MNANDFCYWLQGFAELGDKPPTAAQWKMIQEHLQLVFVKVTSPMPTVITGDPIWQTFPYTAATC